MGDEGLGETTLVYDGLDSTDGTIALSANMGKFLNEKTGDPITNEEIDAIII